MLLVRLFLGLLPGQFLRLLFDCPTAHLEYNLLNKMIKISYVGRYQNQINCKMIRRKRSEKQSKQTSFPTNSQQYTRSNNTHHPNPQRFNYPLITSQQAHPPTSQQQPENPQKDSRKEHNKDNRSDYKLRRRYYGPTEEELSFEYKAHLMDSYNQLQYEDTNSARKHQEQNIGERMFIQEYSYDLNQSNCHTKTLRMQNSSHRQPYHQNQAVFYDKRGRRQSGEKLFEERPYLLNESKAVKQKGKIKHRQRLEKSSYSIESNHDSHRIVNIKAPEVLMPNTSLNITQQPYQTKAYLPYNQATQSITERITKQKAKAQSFSYQNSLISSPQKAEARMRKRQMIRLSPERAVIRQSKSKMQGYLCEIDQFSNRVNSKIFQLINLIQQSKTSTKKCY